MERFNYQAYWATKHKRYQDCDWINKPSFFIKSVIKHFPKTGKALDLGAGQGQDSRYLAKQGYSVVSVDFSGYALKINKQRAEKEGLDYQIKNIDLNKGKLPFEDNSFDVVYSNLSLHYFTGHVTKEIFSEIARVLKPEGVLAMLANSLDDPEVKTFNKVSKYLFLDQQGLLKRYFNVNSLNQFVSPYFNAIILDNKGEMYDMTKPKHLIRFVGKKII